MIVQFPSIYNKQQKLPNAKIIAVFSKSKYLLTTFNTAKAKCENHSLHFIYNSSKPFTENSQ